MNDARHAVVVGGGGGIGLAIARGLADAGHRVTIMGRSADRLAAAVPSMPGAQLRSCDVTDAAAVQAAFASAAEQSGPVAILVNCAGIVRTASFEKTDLAEWEDTWRVNVMGAVHTFHAVLPGMRELGSGRIVNVASTASLKGYAYVSAYVASKHALLGLTRALALELARTGITVNALCPGYTDTDIVAEAVATIVARTRRGEDEALATLTAANPQNRLIDPAEVAGAVQWLISDAARSVTGQAIVIAGGEIM